MVRNDGNHANTSKKWPRRGSNSGGGGERIAASTSPGTAEAAPSQRVDVPADSEANGDRVEGGDGDDGDDDLDSVQFDPNLRDILGDFGLDDDEALPEEGDFWFDDARDFDD